jgi:hypothetical protein
MNTIHVSEMRLENMLIDYWKRFGAQCHQEEARLSFFYWPSCPEVTTEE